MAADFAVLMVTPKRQVASTTATQVVAPCDCGQVTILPLHTPMLSDLQPGLLELRQGSQTERFFVSEGFIEVSKGRVVVLAQSAQRIEDIDSARALADFNAAQARLTKLGVDSANWAHEQGRLSRARGRLEAVNAR